MTHEELLAKINKDIVPGNYHIEAYLALRAIVELHKPQSYKVDWMPDDCSVCYVANYDAEPIEYPCPTIQAIEKELM